MDAWFIWSVIVGAMSIALFIGSRWLGENRSLGRGIALFLSVITAFLFIMSTWTIVGTNKIGIFTSFGKPYTATDNGLEMKRPWAKKAELDAARQFLRFCGDGNNEEDIDKKQYSKIHVKIDGNAKADMCGTVAWQMKATTKQEKANAIQLFRDYREFNRITTNLVYPNVKVVMGDVLAGLNPLVAEKNMSIGDINAKVLAALKAKFDGSIIIQAADISVPDYDPQTDDAIAKDLAQKALTQLAVEKEKTNIAEAKANAAIQTSIQDIKVLINKCLDLAKERGHNPGFCMALASGNTSLMLSADSQAGPQK